MKLNKNLIERACWTFLQAFVSVLIVTGQPISKATLIGAVAGGISALKTFIKETI